MVKQIYGGDMMAIFAVPSNRIVKVSSSDSQDFIKRFNNHTITKKQIETCNSARRLFSHEGRKQK